MATEQVIEQNVNVVDALWLIWLRVYMQITHLQFSYASDVWAFGVVLYELYKCEEPWKGLSPAVAAHKTLSGERLALDPVSENIGRLCRIFVMCFASQSWPENLRSLMTRCWNADPAQRPTMVECTQLLG
jgi:serine/threonine protein kinase